MEDASFVPGEARPLEPPVTETAKDEEFSQALPTFNDPGGDLGLRQLTQMALANSPQFAEAEGNLRVAKARWKIIGEWEDPEIRTSFDWDDVRIAKSKEPGNDDQIRRQESFGTRIRLNLPNPFEIRAELDKAMAEISYGEFALKQVGRDVITDVRRLYQELQFIQEAIRLGNGVYRLELEEYERLNRLLEAGQQLRAPVDNQKLTALGRKGTASSSKIRFQEVRSQLAALVGLADPSRIKVSGVPNRPLIGFDKNSVNSLTEIGFINNLELGDLDRLQALAKGDLKAFNARKIPWTSFIEGGRDRTFRNHNAVSDTWSVRLAIDVPIFSLYSNEGKIYKEQIRSYQKQADLYRKQIRQRVASAVASIKAAREGLGRFDMETQEILGEFKAMESEMEKIPTMKADLVHRANLTSLGRSRERLEAEQAYHDALLNLEVIIRDDIEKVFNKTN